MSLKGFCWMIYILIQLTPALREPAGAQYVDYTVGSSNGYLFRACTDRFENGKRKIDGKSWGKYKESHTNSYKIAVLDVQFFQILIVLAFVRNVHNPQLGDSAK